jgi:hypothetical protein
MNEASSHRAESPSINAGEMHATSNAAMVMKAPQEYQ